MKTTLLAVFLSAFSLQAFAKTDCEITLRLDASQMFFKKFENVGDSFSFALREYAFEYAYSDATKINKLKITHLPTQAVKQIESSSDSVGLIFSEYDYNAARIQCRKSYAGPIDLPVIID
ncbi:hypothetical protein DOM21_15325 [Bacteriovorax stolpii]|uniref:Uncharacterized protein n=1 Tax=Bacteriovorax stolpii TaxID=960 RepID=A0A2K9NP25_BACTC|nr:hypothetical protein [Bacteriovorax stolpii]AUN97266.1 hypothetical protein C0V70_03900 [Bacteriovorax stolpii]QDK42796.1 hypothetical protein DOM21_15325 [Bacteriovorax stolpii]TDP52436.1 hypothetical protein C8D79_2200 [Bacteriovorax stolpii]